MWDSKSSDCILIGYSDTKNLYELWDIEKGTVLRRRDVIFWEDKLGSSVLQKKALPTRTYIFDVSRTYAEHHKASHPYPVVEPELPSVALPPRSLQQTVPSLPENTTVPDSTQTFT